MSAAVVASVLRNRKSGQRRVAPTPHTFTWRRFFLILLLGVVLFIPGIVVTIIGIKNSENLDSISGDISLYKFIGPVGFACGVVMIMASGIYYCCWGYHGTVSTRHAPKHKQSKDQTEQHEPLKNSAVRTILEEGNDASLLPSARPFTLAQRTNDYGTSESETRPIRSERRSNSSRPPRHHTSSTSSTDSRNQSHHSSKHRSSPKSHHVDYSNSPSTNICPNLPSTIPDHQVLVIQTAAPLAQEEAGFGNEQSIDMNII